MFVILFCLQLLGAAFALPCHVQGCQPTRQYLLDLAYNSSRVSVGWKTGEHQPAGLGCSSICDRVACPVKGSPGLVVISTNGETLWKSSELNSPPLPLFYVYEGLIVCDGYRLVGYYYNGTSRGPPVEISYPSAVFSLTKTELDTFLLAFSDGLLYTFDIMAVPIASTFLNDTVRGVKGTFVPYLAPAVGGETGYVLTYFAPDGCTTFCSEISTVRRLYAINNTHLMVPRMNITWYFEFEVSGLSRPTDGQGRSSLLYFDNNVYFAATVKGDGVDGQPTVFALSDAGFQSHQLWEVKISDPVYALSYYSNKLSFSDAVHQLIITTVNNEDTVFTTVDPYSGERQSVVSLHEVLDDNSSRNFTVRVSSDIMVAMPNADLSSPATLIFGYTVMTNESTKNMVGALRLGLNPGLLWHIMTPDGHPVTGQLSNYDCDEDHPSEQLVCTTETTIFSIQMGKTSV